MEKINKSNSLDKYQEIQNKVQKEVDTVKEQRENPTPKKNRYEDTIINEEKKKNLGSII